MLILLFLLPEL